jgi:type IV pilus assembly protein PilW
MMSIGKQQGFTLVELMIALVVGTFLIGGVLSLFVSSQRNFKLDDNISRMQNNGRFAIQELERDLRMAGYMAEPMHPVFIDAEAGLATVTDCGVAGQANWILNLTDAVTGEVNTLTGVDNATAATANAAYSCITAADVVPNTDIVGIKRFAGNSATGALQPNTVYLQSNGLQGLIYQEPAAVLLVGVLSDWEYRPRIYFIRPYTDTLGDGIPSLCRKVLTYDGAVDVDTECIAEGIEDLQLEYGLDVDGDFNVDRYLPNPTLTEMQNVISARVFILARTTDPDIAYSDGRTYSISNALGGAAPVAPNDQFHRRVFSVTVMMFNMRNRRIIGI